MLAGDQALRLALRHGGVAAVIDEDGLDRGAAEVGQADRCGERQALQFGMGGIDDLAADLDRRLGLGAGRSGIAGEREQGADADGVGGVGVASR